MPTWVIRDAKNVVVQLCETHPNDGTDTPFGPGASATKLDEKYWKEVTLSETPNLNAIVSSFVLADPNVGRLVSG